MFKLPVCPHCHTIYRYGDVKKLIFKSKETCYHCHKDFKVSKIKIIILFLLIALITAIFNLIQLYMVEDLSFVALMITNVIFVTVGVFLIPLFINFKLFKSSKNKKDKNQK